MEKVGIIGAGNMGESIVKALLKSGTKKELIVFVETKKKRAAYIEKTYGIRQGKRISELAKDCRFLIIAVKPQDARNILPEMAPFIDSTKVAVSIMAGITMSNILSLTGKPVKIVRVMPNIAVKIGKGVIGISAGRDVSREELKAVTALFSPLGLTIEIGEELMDAVTALGASSPAFLLLFLESMIDAGVKIGIPRDKARVISLQVIKGTIAMLEEEETHPAIMREMITSPGGTTITGLATLEDRAFKGIVIEAIEKAYKRAKELSL